MKTYYVGLDVHSKKSAFVIEDNGGKVIAQGEVATTPEGFSQLQATYQLARGTRVALETGTVAFFVARQLGRLGLDPIVVDAHEVRLKAHRPNQKSDGRDALELCEGLRRGIYRSIVHVPRPEILRCAIRFRAVATSCDCRPRRSVPSRRCCARQVWGA
jgi:transposase